MICKHDAVHEVCRFSDGSVTETISNNDGDISIFHWTKAQAIKLGHRLDVQPSYAEQRAAKIHKYMQQGMTLTEADKKVHDEIVEKEDPGVTKARADLCKQGILKGERCKEVPQTDAQAKH
jgi:hypothetical protein